MNRIKKNLHEALYKNDFKRVYLMLCGMILSSLHVEIKMKALPPAFLTYLETNELAEVQIQSGNVRILFHEGRFDAVRGKRLGIQFRAVLNIPPLHGKSYEGYFICT